jgi:hypothetical protein
MEHRGVWVGLSLLVCATVACESDPEMMTGDPDGGGAPQPVAVGGPCESTDECAGEVVCLSEEASASPGGVCQLRCESDADCPDPAVCFGPTCLSPCGPRGECPAGRVCNSSSLCQAFCISDLDCSEGRLCSPETGRCVATLPSRTPAYGTCLDSAQCNSLRCVDSLCVPICLLEPNTCPGDLVCAGGFEDPRGELGTCFPPCETQADCAPGLFCERFFGGVRGCVPPSLATGQ